MKFLRLLKWNLLIWIQENIFTEDPWLEELELYKVASNSDKNSLSEIRNGKQWRDYKYQNGL